MSEMSTGGASGGGGAPTQMTKKMQMQGMSMGGGDQAAVEVPQLVSDQALRRTAWRLAALADAIMDKDEKTGVATLLSGEDKTNSTAYAELYRDQAAKLDEKRTDDSLLEAVAMIRQDEDVEVPATEEPVAPETTAPENDPFGGK